MEEGSQSWRGVDLMCRRDSLARLGWRRDQFLDLFLDREGGRWGTLSGECKVLVGRAVAGFMLGRFGLR